MEREDTGNSWLFIIVLVAMFGAGGALFVVLAPWLLVALPIAIVGAVVVGFDWVWKKLTGRPGIEGL